MRRALTGFVIIAAVAAAAPAAAQDYTPPSEVIVSPQPGTISASPTTQFSFRGRTAAELGTITVTGSRSGRHSGRVRAHSDGRGASWVPNRRFSGGEHVTVRTGLPIAGDADGDFRVRIARIPDRVTIQKLLLENVAPGKTRSFRSRPDLRPPLVTISPDPKPTQPGYVFLSPKAKNDTKQAGPMITDNAGRVIWWRPLPGIRAATDFRAQTFKGQPVLTYWDGTSRQGIGVGDMVVLNQAYEEIARIKAPNGFRPDLHEFVITPRDTALLIAYPSVRADLRKIGGVRDQLVVDSVVQEIDIATGLVVWEWHSLGRIALNETFSRPVPAKAVPFDYVHFNSVNLDSDGDLLASGRNTWGVYKIDYETGRLIWRLGGKRSTFKLGPGVKFAWQHDAQRRADGLITLFDNSAFPPVRKRSRVLALRLDETRKTASLESAWIHPRRLLAATQGNTQNLPGGGSFVNWGSQRYFTEYDKNGRVLWDARLSVGYESYRGYRLPWVGRPGTRPRVAAVRRSGDRMDVYASWNGTTETVSWEVLGGSSANNLRPLRTGVKTGFETRLPVNDRTSFVAVRARDAAGNVLSTSPARRLSGGG